MYKSYPRLDNVLVKAPYVPIVCKHCGSHNVIRYGTYNGNQRFRCKDCKRKFADNDALPEMQTPVEQIEAAVSMFYEGQSLNSITRLQTQIYGSYPSDSTIYRWVSRFTKRAVKDLKGYKPDVGSIWVADETVLKIDGQNVWFWDMIDAKTRFLIATHISRTRTTKDAQMLMKKAYDRTGKIPRVIYTDKLRAYLDGIELTFGADTKHKQGGPFDVENNTNLIERFHGTLKARTKIMRGLKDIASAKLFTEGWLLYYNYLRPHESLRGSTPAKVAGVKYPYRNWQDIVAGGQVGTISQANATSYMPVPELPEGVKYTILRKRIIKRPKRKKRAGKRENQPVLMEVRG
ncbi:IS6 family transposase [Chloroflexota bacterium]